jgi:glycosyltransferase involved in cell wall biosynthesis
MKLSIVVPCYNEQEVLQQTSTQLTALLDRLVVSGKVSADSGIYFIDDGSKDKTWNLIQDLASKQLRINGIKLSRNRGHQNALLAGLMTVPGDVLISLDSDLQDDVEAIEKMLDAHLLGADIVYGVREDRSSDSFFKRTTAILFYRTFSLLGVESIFNHSDYRLMSRRTIEALKSYKEVNLFLRGIIPLLGFTSSIVFYKRNERFAGESKYPLKKMIAFAWQGITSFSITPLRIVSYIGVTVFLGSTLMSLIIVGIHLFTDKTIPGWTSTLLPIFFLGGIQILCIGIVGEYLGKIYQEVKSRPRFIIEKQCGSQNHETF